MMVHLINSKSSRRLQGIADRGGLSGTVEQRFQIGPNNEGNYSTYVFRDRARDYQLGTTVEQAKAELRRMAVKGV